MNTVSTVLGKNLIFTELCRRVFFLSVYHISVKHFTQILNLNLTLILLRYYCLILYNGYFNVRQMYVRLLYLKFFLLIKYIKYILKIHVLLKITFSISICRVKISMHFVSELMIRKIGTVITGKVQHTFSYTTPGYNAHN